MDEDSLLLPQSTNQTSTPSYKRRLLGGVAGLFLLAIATIALDNRPEKGIYSSDLSIFLEEEEKSKVFSILAIDRETYTFYCDVTSYAYCGEATCVELDEKTSACGCKVISDESGQFSVDSASLVLIESSSFRTTVLEANAGNWTEANNTLCGSLKDGTLWKEAGFNTTVGSFFYYESESSSEISLNHKQFEGNKNIPKEIAHKLSVKNHDSSIKELATDTHGSCMGSPCIETLSWSTNCDIVCICPLYSSMPTTDDDTDDDDDSTCFTNLSVDQSVPWESSPTTLSEYVNNLVSEFDDMSKTKLSSSCSACTVKD